jgi:hypothetical protein
MFSGGEVAQYPFYRRLPGIQIRHESCIEKKILLLLGVEPLFPSRPSDNGLFRVVVTSLRYSM